MNHDDFEQVWNQLQEELLMCLSVCSRATLPGVSLPQCVQSRHTSWVSLSYFAKVLLLVYSAVCPLGQFLHHAASRVVWY